MSLYKVPDFWTNLFITMNPWMGKLHYSNMIVASQDPSNLSSASIKAYETFISNFPDAPKGYKKDYILEMAAHMFGFDGNYK
jgi:hypothetical protein